MSQNPAIIESAGIWFESCGRIFDKNRSLITPKMNFLQRLADEVIDKMWKENLPARVLGLKPRQKGSTTFFGAIDYHMMRRRPTSACVIGGEYSQTEELWKMIQTYNTNDRCKWGHSGEVNAKEGRWGNGSTLKKETAQDVLAGIAGTYQCLHATEVARWSEFGVANAADVLANILKCVPMLPGTLVILESTAEQSSGDFYERWLQAVDAADFLSGAVKLKQGQYVRIFAPWFEFADSVLPDRLTQEQKDMIKETIDKFPEYDGEQMLIDNYARTNERDGITRLGTSRHKFDIWEQLAWRRWAITTECKRDKNIFDRDYPHSWEDAFQKSGELRFNSTGLKVLEKRLQQRVPERGVLEENSKTLRMGFRPTSEIESQVILFERPATGRKYIVSVDPMTGITQTGGKDPDMHGVFAIRAGYYDKFGRWTRPATAARVVQCRWDIDVLEKEIWKLSRYYGGSHGCKIVVEVNKDRGLIELLKLRGADLYERQIFNQREQKTTGALGWETTTATRERIVENLARAIREWDKDGEGIDIFCPDALAQCAHFVKKMNGKSEAANGWHDDDVFSIGIGMLLIEQATMYASDPRASSLAPPDLRPHFEAEQTVSPMS